MVVSWILLELAWGLPKLWAHRVSADSNSGNISNVVAGAIESVH